MTDHLSTSGSGSTSDSKSKSGRSSAMLGVAFVGGALLFAAVLMISRRFAPSRHIPLVPLAERKDFPFSVPLYWQPGGVAVGQKFVLEEHRGRIVVANYFATWCGPCQEEMPDLVKVAKEYAGRGVDFAAVSLDREGENPSKTRAQVLEQFTRREGGVPFPILVPSDDSAIWMGSFSIPQTFIYDKQGRQAQAVEGGIDAGELRGWLEELLKE